MNAMQPPQSIEEIKAGLETTEKGGVRQSIRNCLTVFQRDPLLSGAIAYNILTDRKDIIKPIGFHRESTALNDTDMKYLLLYLEETYGLTNEKKIDNAIGIVANENKYHPIRDYLSALVWDGTERIRFCLRHFLGANMDNKVFKEKIAKTSCGWRGKNVIRRNAIIKMHNENYDIEEFKGESPYINNYIEMLKEKKK